VIGREDYGKWSPGTDGDRDNRLHKKHICDSVVFPNRPVDRAPTLGATVL